MIYESIWTGMPELRDLNSTVSKDFWCQDLPIVESLESGDKRIIRGGLWASQKKFWDLPKEKWIRIFVGGYGSGKTTILMKRMIALALLNSGIPTALCTPNFTNARMHTIPEMKRILEGKRNLTRGLLTYEYSGGPPPFFTIYYKGLVGIIWIVSGDNPETLKGPNLAAAGMDEPFIQDQAVFDQLKLRVRAPLATRRELVIAGTPEGVSNWGQSLCEGELYKSHGGDKGSVGVVRACTYDNLALPQSYLNDLEKNDAKVKRVYIYGEFENLSTGRVYYNFDKFNHIHDLKWSDMRMVKWGVGMDFNVNPMSFVVFSYVVHPVPHVHIEAEYELPNADTEYACEKIRDEWGTDLIDVFPDASGRSRATNAPGGKSDFTILQEHGFRIHAKSQNPSRRDRYNATNRMLSDRVGGRLGVTISSKCTKLSRYLDQYTHEDMNAQESMSHLLDAFSYPIAYLWPVHRPKAATVQAFQ